MKHKTHTATIDPGSIHINEENVIAYMGYKEKTYPQPVFESITALSGQLHSHLNIHAGWIKCPHPVVDVSAGSIVCEERQFNCGKIIVHDLKESEELILFLATIGSKIQEWSDEKMKQNDLLAAYIIDILGSIAVESAVDILHSNILEKNIKNKQKLSNRYSPGYCGWNVEEQHNLFSFFPEGFCGITLTDSALMLPVKSISGIIGIGEFIKKREYRCGICSQKDCIMRKKK
ncbi:MAG: hypothetical protein JXJ04_02470 [Spirochaetales bacterium]|nr:hypothetical protein [Spirochaetales bacterium]